MTKEVINELKKYTLGKKNTEKVEISVLQLNRVIKALEQEPKTGHWIITYPHGKQNPIYECPHCHASNSSVFKNFCPNCGCRMVEPQESEEMNESEKIKYNQGFVDGYKKATEQSNAVIKDIKAEIPILSHWQTDDGQDLLMIADALECIDKHTRKEQSE